MRAGAAFIFFFACGCAGLEPLEPAVCGNGVVEPEAGEDCDLFASAGGENLVCPRVPEPNACKYICTADRSISCPNGWSCGPDGVCRYASGRLTVPRASPLRMPNDRFEVLDADGDQLPDLIAQLGGSISAVFNDREGSFEARSELPLDRVSGTPVFAESKVLAATDVGWVAFRLAEDRRFDPLIASTELPASAVGAVGTETGVLYFWTREGSTVATFDPALEPKRIADRPLSELASPPSVFGDTVAFAYAGADEVIIAGRPCVMEPCVFRRVSTPAPIAAGAIFQGSKLYVDTERGMASADRDTDTAALDNELFLDGSDFPLATGDFDGDGGGDFAAPLCIYYSDWRRVCGGARVQAVSGDFDGDGIVELASIDASADFIEVRSAGVVSRVDLLDRAKHLVSGDFDGDGFDDLTWVEDNTNDGRGRVYTAFGGASGLEISGARQLEQRGITALAVAPILGEDALDDLVLVFTEGGVDRTATAMGSPRRRLSVPRPLANARAIAAGRFTTRDALDAVVFADQGVYLYGGFDRPDAPPAHIFMPCFDALSADARAIAVKRDAGDGAPDVLVLVDGETLVELRFSNAELKCTSQELPMKANELRSLRAADLDQDGALDLVIDAEPVLVAFGFNASEVSPLMNEHYSASVLNADSDPLLELAVLSVSGVSIADLDEQRRLSLASEPLVSYAQFGFGTITTPDLDGDGLADLAYSDRELVHFRVVRPHNEIEGVEP